MANNDPAYNENNLKFACDCMLGKLAKYMRIAGIDTFYRNYIDDKELIQTSIKESRILLTKDNALLSRNNLPENLCIVSQNSKEQFTQVLSRYPEVKKYHPFTRCSICNAQLDIIDKTQVESLIPPYVFKTQDEFKRCPVCTRIYWRATHVENMKFMKESNN